MKEEKVPEARLDSYRPEVSPNAIAREVDEKLQKYLAKQTERATERTDYDEVSRPLTEDELEKEFRENLQEYLASKPEPPTESTPAENEIEPNAVGTETESTEGMESAFELTLEAAEPVLENHAETKFEAPIERGPELYESYELPVKDLELLLAELDAYPLETDIEAKQEVEKVENAERPL